MEIKEAWDNLISLLPEWAKDKANIFLLADQELVIHQAKGYEVHIKKDRCIQCGAFGVYRGSALMSLIEESEIYEELGKLI